MNSPSDRGRRLASMSPSPTVRAAETSRSDVSSGSSSSNRLTSYPTLTALSAARWRGGLRLRGEHLVGGLLGLLERKPKSDKRFHHRAADRVTIEGHGARRVHRPDLVAQFE